MTIRTEVNATLSSFGDHAASSLANPLNDGAAAADVEHTAAAAATEVEVENGGEMEGTMITDLPVAAGHSDRPLQYRISMSEAAQDTSVGWKAPKWISWIEVPFKLEDPKTKRCLDEATGFAMDCAGRGPLVQCGGYLGGAILRLALLDAGCDIQDRYCHNTIRGLRPSSMLTLSSAVAGVVCAFLLPIFGAIVDHTRYRKAVGTISAFMTVIITGMQTSISAEKNNWLFILILDALQSVTLLIHVTATFAYLPDFTTDHDSMPTYTTHFMTRQYMFQVTYVSFIIIAGEVRGASPGIEASIKTAIDSSSLATVYGTCFMLYAWVFLFKDRPALSEVPKGTNLVTASFVQVNRTARKVVKRYKALKWFMISILLSPEAGAGVVLTLAVTFLTVVMRFTPLDIAKLLLLVMFATFPGAYFSRTACRRFNPLNSYRAGMFMIGVGIGSAVLYLDSADKRAAVYGFGVFWGASMGWTYSSQRVLFVTLTPRGQETELMGLFFFMGQILGWLPPLIFTIMNENGISPRWGFGIMTLFCWSAVLLTIPMGSYEEAVLFAQQDSAEKFEKCIEAATDPTKYAGKESSMVTKHNNSDSENESNQDLNQAEVVGKEN